MIQKIQDVKNTVLLKININIICFQYKDIVAVWHVSLAQHKYLS